ncbi:DUF3786 domain-containing protein [Chloroflexota bacterium]
MPENYGARQRSNKNRPDGRYLNLSTLKAQDYGYGLAYQLAREQLASIDDIEQQCLKADTQYMDSQKINIKYLNQPYLIALPDIKISFLTGEETVPIRDKILVLHYFTTAKGTPLSNRMITFKELPEGINYLPTFSKRTIKPLVSNFGDEPQRMADIAGTLGGYKADYGDMAVTINAFRRVPITLVLWQGDEEFTSEGNILFDSTIVDYLPTEDIIVLCEVLVWKLIKLLKAGGDNPDRN